MGYTHYWAFQEQPTKEKFAEFLEGVKQIVATAEEAGIEIGEQKYESDYVSFNGVGTGAHETFYIELPSYDDGFCKTAEKPYDAVVTAILIHAKAILGNAIEIKSDGNWDEWDSGKVLYETVFYSQPESVLA